MGRIATGLLALLAMLLAGCSTNQLKQETLKPVTALPYSALLVQVQFADPAHSAYLAGQLGKRLATQGVRSNILLSGASPATAQDKAQALLQLRLTEAWTDTVITTRHMPRRSLTQMRGRIPRESDRFNSTARLVDLASGETVWQTDIHTAAAWYTEFPTQADALAAKLTQQLQRQGLIANGS